MLWDKVELQLGGHVGQLECLPHPVFQLKHRFLYDLRNDHLHILLGLILHLHIDFTELRLIQGAELIRISLQLEHVLQGLNLHFPCMLKFPHISSNTHLDVDVHNANAG